MKSILKRKIVFMFQVKQIMNYCFLLFSLLEIIRRIILARGMNRKERRIYYEQLKKCQYCKND